MSSSSSSNTETQWVYDVFLSFRGKDTRKKFVSHLYAALSSAGIYTFLDDEELNRGEEVGRELLQAIATSRICIVVFSQNYVESRWCLKELVQIMECRTTTGLVVLPVFYDVTPSSLGFKEIASETIYEENGRYTWFQMGIEVEKAMDKASRLAGWDVRNYRSDSKLVKEIVDTVLKKLGITCLSMPKFPTGLESRTQDLAELLNKQSERVCIIGIWGMGGIGKTTIAKAFYNKIHREFKQKSFLANIREIWEKDRGQIDLQEQLLSDILKLKKMKIHSIEWGKCMIKERLCRKRALIVLDDVTKIEQLNALCENREWIGLGSLIIVTTRDVHILKVLKVDYTYSMKKMDQNESLELFSWHAFRKASPQQDFFELSINVVAHCGGLPLALEVFGSYLYLRTKEEWKSILSKLKRIPNDQIQEKLRISFDGLRDHMLKDIFLDICCFFIGKDIAYVTQILNGCELHADIGITILIERSLIKVEKNNKLGMHALLRDMGIEIIRECSPKEPAQRSRLCIHEDVLEVLRENTGTKAIEGLALKLPKATTYSFNTNAFEKMQRLRLLALDHVQLVGDYKYLPKQLRWLYWQRFPLKYMPENFYQENLVAIDLKRSNLKQVWKKPQLMENLKFLNLSHSLYLTNTPDFSKIPNLERLILKNCPSLSKVHESIGALSSLLLLNLMDCTSLNNLPRSIYKLKSLKNFILSGCSKIDKLEEDIGQMESLTTLVAENTAVKQVPFSLVRSKSIGYISLCGYEGLASDVFPLLIWSWMSLTTNPISSITSFGSMSSSVVYMDEQKNYLGDLSAMFSSLSKLRSVWVYCHSEFQLTQELRRILDDTHDEKFSIMETNFAFAAQTSKNCLRSYLIGMGSYHQVLNALSKRITKGLASNGPSDFFLPEDNYPYCLSYTGEGHSVLFHMPKESDCCMKGMTLSIVYSSNLENMASECLISVLIVNYTKFTIQIYKKDTTVSFNDEEWLGIISNLGPGDKVEIFVATGHGVTVKCTTIYLIYGESEQPLSEQLAQVEHTSEQSFDHATMQPTSEQTQTATHNSEQQTLEHSVPPTFEHIDTQPTSAATTSAIIKPAPDARPSVVNLLAQSQQDVQALRTQNSDIHALRRENEELLALRQVQQEELQALRGNHEELQRLRQDHEAFKQETNEKLDNILMLLRDMHTELRRYTKGD